MASSTENEAGVGISSDEVDRTFLCQPCEEEGEELMAVGFCVNCSEYLCQRCYDGHLIPSVTRKHVLELLEQEHKTETKLDSKYSCQQHENKDIDYHCPTHSFLGCHICFFQHQKSCKDGVYIPEVSKTVTTSDEFVQFNRKLTYITSKCTELVSEVKSKIQVINTGHTEAIDDIRAFKQEIVEIIDTLEKELLEKADKIHKEKTIKMEELSLKCETILHEIQKMPVGVEMLQNKENPCDVFIEMVQSEGKIQTLKEQLQAIEHDVHVKYHTFQPNKDLLDIVKSTLGLGSLETVGKRRVIKKLEYVQDINCKSRNDTTMCTITGSVLLPDQKLIIIDWENASVKLIDISQNEVKSDLKLATYPRGVCRITDSMVAVTSATTILFLGTGTTLVMKKTMNVKGIPRGIGHLDGKLAVSYSTPNTVEIMDMNGTVIKTLVTDIYGQPLFDNPSHVAVHPDNQTIYVTNFNNNKVVCVDFDGTVVATYKDNELKGPRQITFDSNGMVYVCGQESNNVHQLTDTCEKIKVLLTSTDGLRQPKSISYQVTESEERLYIGQKSCNSVKVYRIVYSYL